MSIQLQRFTFPQYNLRVAELPDGVITFLLTDVEGSTRIWEEAPDSMMHALEQHDEAIDEAAAPTTGSR